MESVIDYIAASIRQEEQICLGQNSRTGAACSSPTRPATISAR